MTPCPHRGMGAVPCTFPDVFSHEPTERSYCCRSLSNPAAAQRNQCEVPSQRHEHIHPPSTPRPPKRLTLNPSAVRPRPYLAAFANGALCERAVHFIPAMSNSQKSPIIPGKIFVTFLIPRKNCIKACQCCCILHTNTIFHSSMSVRTTIATMVVPL